MPVAIMAMGIVFNLLNGMMQAGGLFYFAPEGLYADGWAYLLKPHALLGIILFCGYVRQFAFRLCDTSSAQAG